MLVTEKITINWASRAGFASRRFESNIMIGLNNLKSEAILQYVYNMRRMVDIDMKTGH